MMLAPVSEGGSGGHSSLGALIVSRKKEVVGMVARVPL